MMHVSWRRHASAVTTERRLSGQAVARFARQHLPCDREPLDVDAGKRHLCQPARGRPAVCARAAQPASRGCRHRNLEVLASSIKLGGGLSSAANAHQRAWSVLRHSVALGSAAARLPQRLETVQAACARARRAEEVRAHQGPGAAPSQQHVVAGAAGPDVCMLSGYLKAS